MVDERDAEREGEKQAVKPSEKQRKVGDNLALLLASQDLQPWQGFVSETSHVHISAIQDPNNFNPQ